MDLERLINPTDRQREFLKAVADHDFVLYGGAAGGGKSYILRWWLVLFLCWLYKAKGLKNVQVGLFCEDYPSLNDRHISKIQFEFPHELGTLKQGVVKNFVLRPEFGGGVIALRNLDDPSKYLSSEFAAMAVDELTKNQLKVFDFLRMRLRWPGVERPKFAGGTNPGGEGHAWVKKLWLEKDYPTELQPFKEQFHFVGAKASDNPHLTESYYKNLQSLPAYMARAYAEGSWDIFAGQYFANWQKEQHVISLEGVVIQPWWRKWISIDWGYGHHSAVGWHVQAGTLDEDGRKRPLTITYREYVVKGLSERALAQEIVARNDGDKIQNIFAGHDLWKEESSGQTKESAMSKVFVAAGLPSMKHAKINRVDGWRLMHLMLDEGEWLVSDQCPQIIGAIPQATHNEDHLEDVLKTTDAGDDIRDMLRYGLYSMYGPDELPFEIKLKAAVAHLEDRTNRNMQLTKIIGDRERELSHRGMVNNRSSARGRRWGS